MDIASLPTLNAVLNATSACFLLLGYGLIRRKAKKAHAVCMTAACATSALFLISYLYYHYHHGSTSFSGQGGIRVVYFTILISHTILAALIVPLVIVTLSRALRGRFEKHVKIARITLPIWLYVSVTGVLIYGMLYHFPSLTG